MGETLRGTSYPGSASHETVPTLKGLNYAVRACWLMQPFQGWWLFHDHSQGSRSFLAPTFSPALQPPYSLPPPRWAE